MTAQTQDQATDADATVNGLIQIASRLVELMERETQLLRAMRPSDIVGMQDDKARLVAAYQERSRELRADPSHLAMVRPVLKQELRQALEHFEEASEANGRALAAAREANERLLRAIVDAVAGRQAQSHAYASDGGLASNNGKSKGVSITLNQEL